MLLFVLLFMFIFLLIMLLLGQFSFPRSAHMFLSVQVTEVQTLVHKHLHAICAINEFVVLQLCLLLPSWHLLLLKPVLEIDIELRDNSLCIHEGPDALKIIVQIRDQKHQVGMVF